MKYKYEPVEITKEDLRKIVYFILMKFRADSLHVQGTSSKRDLLGGYIERWFNKVAETVIFDDLLKNKEYNVVSDYFLYANDSEKNAPDIIGLETKDGNNIPFVKYKNGSWHAVEGMPRIEVKVVRKDQNLMGVREAQMIDDYYIFIESDLEEDYLSAIFEDKVFKKKYLDQLEISKDFVESDDSRQLISHWKLKKNNKIGKMRLIGVYAKEEVEGKFTSCSIGVKPYYFAGATKNFNKKIDHNKKVGELEVKNGLAQYNNGNEVYLPFPIEGLNRNQRILVSNKGSVYIDLENDVLINGEKVEKGVVKIDFKKFDRSSNWCENIALKTFIEEKGNDATDDLIKLFDDIVGFN